MARIYLDHNATTAPDPAVVEAMLPFLTERWGNPSSLHAEGNQARQAVSRAREQVASLIGAHPDEIVFTSGGTEANNLALKGALSGLRSQPARVVTSAIEHQSIRSSCEALARAGHETAQVPVDAQGRVAPDAVAETASEGAAVVSVMLANNEVGTLQPVAQLASLLRGPATVLHSDAVQAVGKVAVDVGMLGVDLLSLSAHKLHGPKGVGALFVRRGVSLGALLHGGHQERRRRAGTENVPGIVGLGRACALAASRLERDARHVKRLRDRLERRLAAGDAGLRVHGHPEHRLPNTLSVSFPAVAGEELAMSLDARDIAVSTGSACASGGAEPAYVLIAMGIHPAAAHGAVRFSLGRGNTEAEVDRTADEVLDVVRTLRAEVPFADDGTYRPRPPTAEGAR